VLVLLSPLPQIFAQEEYESAQPRREIESQARARRSAQAAQALQPPEAVSYEQVLADPDNPELNFLYAKKQIAQGDLKGASATLERLLLIKPDLPEVRLLQGVVLFRLDNIEEAEQALRAAQKLGLSASLKQEADDFLRQIARKRKTTRWLANLTTGFQYDDNRNAAPQSEQQLVLDSPSALSGSSVKRDDAGFIAIHTLQVTQDLGMQAGHQAFASMTHYLGEQTQVDSLDLASFSVVGGGIFRAGFWTLIPSAFADHVNLSRETYLRSQGLDLKVARPLNNRLNFLASTRLAREDFSGITENAAGAERRGVNFSVNSDLEFSAVPTFLINGGLGYNNKDAKASYEEYEGPEIRAGYTWLWGKGQFFLNNITYTINDYDDNDPLVSARSRRDAQYRIRVTYGAPVVLFLPRKFIPKAITDNSIITLTYEHLNANSNIENYAYLNNKFSAMVSKTVEF
ncbi:MAG: DUF560 domain-containing protein, partial [Candidatus Omnitrophica bacterium]|nr:DUF560 domain-containing protein [Candidatus Omnitrophota bacterium]